MQAQHSFQIQAHRGARAHFPENTLHAFDQSVNAGFRIIEMDVVISEDLQIVVSHDPWLNPSICGQNSQLISEKIPLYRLSYQEIKNYDCGSFGNPNFPNQQKIAASKPLLKDVFLWANQKEKEIGEKLVLNIEIKSRKTWEKKGMPNYKIMSDSVIVLLKEYNRLDKDIIQSFDTRTLKYLQQQESSILLSYLVGNANLVRSQFKKLGFVTSFYSPYYRLVNAKNVKVAQELGSKVVPWTVNDSLIFKKLLSYSIDGIISDDPQLLRLSLQENQK